MTDVTSVAADARSLRSRMSLRFALQDERTALVCAERTPPMHVQRLLYLDQQRPALAQAAILNTTAGLFAGDRLDLTVRVAAGAAVELTTPTSTRIFSMSDDFAGARTRIAVESGGYLEYVPRPTILCRDAALRVSTSVVVEAGGVAAVGDVIAFGRIAAGEAHRYRWLDQRIDLSHDGGLILAEALRLARDDQPDAVGVVGGAAALGALHLIGTPVDPADLLSEARRIVEGRKGIRGGASTLHGGAGVAVRVLGHQPNAVYETLQAIARMVRCSYFASARP